MAGHHGEVTSLNRHTAIPLLEYWGWSVWSDALPQVLSPVFLGHYGCYVLKLGSISLSASFCKNLFWGLGKITQGLRLLPSSG